jgi:hypothetical protein
MPTSAAVDVSCGCQPELALLADPALLLFGFLLLALRHTVGRPRSLVDWTPGGAGHHLPLTSPACLGRCTTLGHAASPRVSTRSTWSCRNRGSASASREGACRIAGCARAHVDAISLGSCGHLGVLRGLTCANGRVRASSAPLAFTVIPRCSPLNLVRLWCRPHGIETTLGACCQWTWLRSQTRGRLPRCPALQSSCIPGSVGGGPGTARDLTNGRASSMAKERPASAGRAPSSALRKQTHAFQLCWWGGRRRPRAFTCVRG